MAEDRKLVRQAKGGDKDAFGDLVRRHQRRVYRTALSFAGDHGAADDIAQESFLRAFLALPRFDERSEFGTWLYRIVVNVSLSHVKRHGPVQVGVGLAEEEAEGGDQAGPEQRLEQRRLRARLLRALEGLPDHLRATAVLVGLQGLPHRVVAEILGCSEGTVSWRMHQVRKELRRWLDDDLGVSESPVEGERR
jgi:RNA polymerase sigma-70 factor (ECF subfamily)